jgi:alpha-methylacyl-CoA racemase
VTPVLSFAEVAAHPHMAARSSLVEIDGVLQAAPAPRFSRTPPDVPSVPPTDPVDVAEVLRGWARPT